MDNVKDFFYSLDDSEVITIYFSKKRGKGYKADTELAGNFKGKDRLYLYEDYDGNYWWADMDDLEIYSIGVEDGHLYIKVTLK